MESTKVKKALSIRDICYIGIFVAIIAVCAQIRIPLPGGVPFTLQTLAVALSGLVLGAKRGVIATVIYILLGAIGLPIFTLFGSGFGVVFGLTGGFIMTFPIMAFLAGICSRQGKVFLLAVGLFAGVAVNLTIGMLWFAFVAQSTIQSAFVVAVAPFILPEVFKMVVVFVVGKSIQVALLKAGLAI